MIRIQSIALLLAISILAGCNNPKKEEAKASISSSPFGEMPDGQKVSQFTLVNTNGIEMKAITYGGIITSLMVPDKDGNLDDVVLGYDNLQGYLDATPYFGAIIGRFGNRIAKGKFSLDGEEYTLAVNNIGNHLHGGIKGFDKVVWTASEIQNEKGVGIKYEYTSPDMEEGYPGNLSVTVVYMLGNDNSLSFDYEATTDKKTVVNLTQHSYFNLAGNKGDILSHKLTLNAPQFLPVDSTLIPTGELRNVEGTPFDFTISKVIGEEINTENQQLQYGGGYDHCWILADGDAGLNFAASLFEPKSGRQMDIYTTEPAIQFYSGNFLDGSIKGKNGVSYEHRTGLCLETEHYPDAPNQPVFPTVVLEPGQVYHSVTKYVFSVKK